MIKRREQHAPNVSRDHRATIPAKLHFALAVSLSTAMPRSAKIVVWITSFRRQQEPPSARHAQQGQARPAALLQLGRRAHCAVLDRSVTVEIPLRLVVATHCTVRPVQVRVLPATVDT